MSDLPELHYDDIDVGQRFTPTIRPLTREMVANYARSVHDHGLAELAGKPDGTVIPDTSLAILFTITRQVLAQDFRLPPGGVLARQEYEVTRRLKLGEVVRTESSIAAKYEKKGRRYVELRSDLFDAEGALIGHAVNQVLWAR